LFSRGEVFQIRNPKSEIRNILLLLLLVLVPAGAALAAEHPPVKPTARDKCPVCGMFVAKYPDFVAEVIYRDGSYAVFDGAKDLFKYLLNPKAYAPTRQPADIEAIYVTDYYSLALIDGRRAWYVIGSDVHGPMGRELIPFGSEVEAKQFLFDHKGKRLLRFEEIAADVVKGLD
jgi:nitrous oxide reductase accessory protein NosL